MARSYGWLLAADGYWCAKRREVLALLQIACPAASDKVVEAFVRKTLAPDQATSFKRHIACCSKCAEEVENTRAFALAMGDALRAIQLRHSSSAASPSNRRAL